MSNDDVWWVVKAGDADDLAEVLNKKQLDVNIVNEQGRTLAHVAADYNYASILKFLHGKGAKMDMKDKHGITPLLCAIWEGHVASVEFLLSVGANAKGTTPDGQSFVDAAESEAVKNLLKARLRYAF